MRQLAIVALLVACNNEIGVSGGGGGGGIGGAVESATKKRGPAPDWSSKKLVMQEGSADGIAFTIQVPEGLPRDPRQPGDWEDERKEYDQAPKIFTQTIEVSRIQSLKDAKYHATLDAAEKTWTRNLARPDGWAVTYAEPDKTRVEAITYRQADKKFIKCKAVQTSDHPLPSYAKTVAMLEAICESVKPVPK